MASVTGMRRAGLRDGLSTDGRENTGVKTTPGASAREPGRREGRAVEEGASGALKIGTLRAGVRFGISGAGVSVSLTGDPVKSKVRVPRPPRTGVEGFWTITPGGGRWTDEI